MNESNSGCYVHLHYCFQASGHNEKRFIFVFHLVSCVGQLLMFTYSCDGLIHESVNVGEGAYGGPWTCLSMDKYGATLRKDLLFLLARTKIPCCITARGFCVVSLGTYTSVIICNFLFLVCIFTIILWHKLWKIVAAFSISDGNIWNALYILTLI